MSTYYVATTGNDATGDGSVANPWRTLRKALTTISTGVEHTVLLAEGTYAEDSGSGYLALTQSRTALVTIAPVNGSSGSVTITGTSGSYNVLVPAAATAAMFRFEYITFAFSSASALSCVSIHTNGNAQSLTFYRCTFVITEGASTHYGFYCAPNSGKTVSGITFDTCTFAYSGTYTATSWQVYAVGLGGTLTGLTVRNCQITSLGGGIWALGGTIYVCDTTVLSTNAQALMLGTDAYAADTLATYGTIERCYLRSAASHTVSLGCAATDVVFRRNSVYGGDIGIVAKNSSGCRIEHNLVVCTDTAGYAMYDKASQGTLWRFNLAVSTKSGGYVFFAGPDSTRKYANVRLERNALVAGAGTIAARWNSADETGAGSISNGNVYIVFPGGTLASLNGTSVNTVAALNAAWAAIGRTCDTYSREGSPGCEATRGRPRGGYAVR